GMSTVPEAIVARQCGLAVAGLSCVTNLAAGRGKGALSHEEVLATGKRVGQTATELLEEFAQLYATAIKAGVSSSATPPKPGNRGHFRPGPARGTNSA